MRAPAEVQFAQKLAANEKSDRDKAVKKLKKWCYTRSSGPTPFQEDEMMKIWKGLFYCYWMSDKPLVQEELAINISSMIGSFNDEESSLLFIKSFILTMGREWFGIDKWRMDKFMMFVRRFIRQMFRFNKSGDWAEDLTEKLSNLLADNLLLVNITKTSLGLQMHITDIFLEELAKVGGEELDEGVLNIYLKPFIKVVSEGRETRLRDHVVQRIFQHLIRQSDPGIQWEADKDIEAMGHVELVEDVDEDEEGAGEEGDDENEDGDEELRLAEDPRAGRVDVELPQMKLDYAALGEKLFDIGASESTMKANRTILNNISKMFKDVSNDVFPLGDDASDVEEQVEKINVKAALTKLADKQEKIKRKNQRSKEEYRAWKKEQDKEEREALRAGETQDFDEDEEDEDGAEEEDEEMNELKRKMDEEEEEEEESPEAKKMRVEENKEKRREKEKKRKQEMKRKKREKMLADKIKENEAQRQSDLLLQKDLEIRTTLDPEQSPEDLEPPVKKVKKTKKEKRAEKLKLNGHATDTITPEPTVNGHAEVKKKKEKKEKSGELNENSLKPTNTEVVKPSETDTTEKSKKKKMKKNKEKETEEVSQPMKVSELDNSLNLREPSPEIKKKKKKKKDKQNNTASEEIEKEDTTTQKSKPAKVKVPKETGGKLFDESADWDAPEEKTKKKSKPKKEELAKPVLSPVKPVIAPVAVKPVLSPKAEKPAKPVLSTGFAGFDPPKVSTPTLSTTAVFLKKAMSKSATPKKKKGGRMDDLKQKELSSSEPRAKRVNFQLTRNMSQDISELYSSIASSPGIPHDPARAPEKGLLKKTTSVIKNNGHSHPLQLNTQLNAASPRSNQFIEKKMKKQKTLHFPASSKLIGKKKKHQ